MAAEGCEICSLGDVGRSEGVAVGAGQAGHFLPVGVRFLLGSGGRAFRQLAVLSNLQRGGNGAVP